MGVSEKKDVSQSVWGLSGTFSICVSNESCSCLSASCLLREQAGITASLLSLLSCVFPLSHHISVFDSVSRITGVFCLELQGSFIDSVLTYVRMVLWAMKSSVFFSLTHIFYTHIRVKQELKKHLT